MKILSKAFLIVWLKILKPIEQKKKINKINQFTGR